MKPQIIYIFIGIGTLVVLLFPAPRAMSEEGAPGGGISTIQAERNLAPEDTASLKQSDAGGSALRSESILPLQARSNRRATAPERESQALEFHQNTLLDRFGGADNHGQIFLSFSANRIDLMLRSLTGEEAPV